MIEYIKDKHILEMGWVLTVASVVALAWQGISRSFFHQDDVVELAMIADWRGWESVLQMNNEHLNITFWPLLRLMWQVAGVSYPPYLILNIIFHILVMYLIYKIVRKLTKSVLWSSVVIWGFVINSNWFTVIWWVTGLMMMEAVSFALIAYWIILRIKDRVPHTYLYPLLFVFSVLPGMSWGVGITWPIWPLLVYGIDYARKRINSIGWTLLAAQLTLFVAYFTLVGDSISVHSNPDVWLSNPLKILSFVLVGVSNTLVGRWIVPFENFELRVLGLSIIMIIFIYGKYYKKIADQNIIFGIVVAIGSFVTYAIPRWSFGIGHAMANYYAYFPLAFLMVTVAVFFAKLQLVGWRKMLILIVFLTHIPLSWIGFESWAGDWVRRPQQAKTYFAEINSLTPHDCLVDDYLPTYIVPQPVFRTSFIWPIFKKDWDPFCLLD